MDEQNDIFFTFRKRMKEQRQVQKKTLYDMAMSCGTREATIHRYESGQIKKIPMIYVTKISEFLGCDVSYMLGYTDTPKTIGESPDLTEEEIQLLNCYRSINDRKKEFLIMVSKYLVEDVM